MATTLGLRWFERNPPTKIRWWHPRSRSDDGFDVRYNEEEHYDWRPTQSGIGHGPGTVVDQVELSDSNGTVIVAAMKIYRKNGEKNLEKNMLDEVKALRILTHIHVVEVIGSVVYPRYVAYFMRPRAEFTLSDLLEGLTEVQTRRRDLENKVWFKSLNAFLISTIGCLAQGLAYIHSQSIAHKDIKPTNILVDGARVYYADFGIAKIYEDSTVSTGPTPRSTMWAPLESLESLERHRSQDIFSLGTCYAEIFASYKNRNVVEIRAWPEQSETLNKTNSYAYHVPAVLEWLKKHLVVERCDIQLWNLIREMLATDQSLRPTAKTVWEEAVIITSRTEGIHFCGACCMPVIPGTIPEPKEPPAPHTNIYSSDILDNRLIHPNKSFKTVYHPHHFTPYDWKRNLRIANQTGLDAVDFRGEPFLARKIISPKNDSYSEIQRAASAACSEAEILQRLHDPVPHHHIVSLHDTYRQGQNHIIVINPLADFDLKTYLAFVESPNAGLNLLKEVGDPQRLLRISFGCLANALRHVHAKSIVHGDLSSRNILVKPEASQNLYIAEFGQAAWQASQINTLSTFNAADENVVDYMHDNAYTAPETLRPQSQTHAHSSDIFALGCVFVEIETVRKGSTLQNMRDFLLESDTPGAAVKVIYRREKEIGRLPLWIKKLEQEHQTLPALAELMCSMLERDATRRPTAQVVLETVARCKEGAGVLCGKYCVPD